MSNDDHTRTTHKTYSQLTQETQGDDETKPETSLGPESEVKKKRFAKKKFEEMCQIAQLEILQLHTFIRHQIQRLSQEKLERALKDEEASLNEKESNPLKDLPVNIDTLNGYLLDATQIEAFERLKDKISACILLIDEQINRLDKMLDKIDDNMKRLDDSIQASKSAIIALCKEHFNDANAFKQMSTTQIPLRIPPGFTNLINAARYQGRITVDSNFYFSANQLLIDILDKNRSKDKTFYDMILQAATAAHRDAIIKNLKQYLPANVDQAELNKLADKMLELPAVKKSIESVAANMLNNLMEHDDLRQAMNNHDHYKHQHAIQKQRHDIIKEVKVKFSDYKEMLCKNSDKLDALLAQENPKTSANPDSMIKEMNLQCAKINKSIQKYLPAIDSLLTSIDSLTTTVDRATTEIKHAVSDSKQLLDKDLDKFLAQESKTTTSIKQLTTSTEDSLLNDVEALLKSDTKAPAVKEQQPAPTMHR